MVINFIEYTEPLTEKERKLLRPYIMYLLNYAFGRVNAKKSNYIVKHLKEYNSAFGLDVGSIDGVLVGKMSHDLRASMQIPNLVATSDGYFIANKQESIEVDNCIESLRQRARSINYAADIMEAGIEAGLQKYTSGYVTEDDIEIKFFYDSEEEKKVVGILNEFKYFDTNNNRIKDRISAYRNHVRSKHPKKRLTRDELSRLTNKEFSENMIILHDANLYKRCSVEIVIRVRDMMDSIEAMFIAAPKPNTTVANRINEIIHQANDIMDVCNKCISNRKT